MLEFDPPPLSANFMAGIETLPTAYDENIYMQFISAFGTHYVTSALMGGAFVK